MDYEERIEKAVALFNSGFNCSQSVVAAFADMYGFTEEQALRMSASFGAGMGRMRETCGAVCGMFLLAGLECGQTDPKDAASKTFNYKVVQELAAKIKEQNGSIRCADLLGQLKEKKTTHVPEARTAEYYAKRPCPRMVECAARIWVEKLKELRGE
ncbi:MAG: C_GCAxxG_C_C family protein [Paludibacteraceae bacterium]|nr:C_GCAxxG_C_C family protein [Paludibacteraceae bacterium]